MRFGNSKRDASDWNADGSAFEETLEDAAEDLAVPEISGTEPPSEETAQSDWPEAQPIPDELPPVPEFDPALPPKRYARGSKISPSAFSVPSASPPSGQWWLSRLWSVAKWGCAPSGTMTGPPCPTSGARS